MGIKSKLKHWCYVCFPRWAQSYFYDTGVGNKVIIVENERERLAYPGELRPLKIRFEGNYNTVRVSQPIEWRKSELLFRGSHCSVDIQGPCWINLRLDFISDGGEFKMGPYCHAVDVQGTLAGNTVFIGHHCMLSRNILLLDDTHSVLDAQSHQVLNREKSVIKIGNHCWIGERVTLLKKASIPDDSIVGYGAIVTKPFKTPHVVLAGNPARVVKSGVTWHSLPPKNYTEKQAREMSV